MDTTAIDSAINILSKNNESYLANSLLALRVQKSQPDFKLINELAIRYFKSKNYIAAKTCFAELKKILNTFEVHYYFAKICENLNNHEEAKENYLDALLLSTLDLELLFEANKNLGNLYLKEKNLDIAEDFYHKAYTINPDSPQLLVNLGTLELQRKELGIASERFRKALRINPRFSHAWVGLSLCYLELGEQALSWGSILKSIEHDPENSTALLLAAKWCLKNDAIEITLQHLMNFFDRGHFDLQISLSFIELCIKKNDFYLARVELERSLLWSPKQVELLQFDRALYDHGY